MKAVANPAGLEKMPNVAAWLRHCSAAEQVVTEGYPELTGPERARAVSLENVVAQLNHLRTHPSVAAGLSAGKLNLHAWVYKFETGQVFAYDPQAGQFLPLDGRPTLGVPSPVRSKAVVTI